MCQLVHGLELQCLCTIMCGVSKKGGRLTEAVSVVGCERSGWLALTEVVSVVGCERSGRLACAGRCTTHAWAGGMRKGERKRRPPDMDIVV